MEICKNCAVLAYVVMVKNHNNFYCPWKGRRIGARGKVCSKFKGWEEGYNGELKRMSYSCKVKNQ